MEKATFAGGCFWCLEPPFRKLEGVSQVLPGYAGGPEKDPTYTEVSSGATGHVEAVQIEYDPAKVAYEELLEIFWRNIDPTDGGGQFADRGGQYQTVVFYHNEKQKEAAERSKKALEESGKFKNPVVTPVRAFTSFYPAEEYHREYSRKNPAHYKMYRMGSGREGFLREKWGGHE